MNKTFLLVVLSCLSLMSCGQESKSVKYFKDTEAYKLAQLVEKNDTLEIKRIVSKNSKLLEVTNPISGSNVLDLALILENYEAFKALLDLGGNPNFVNPLTKRSVLIDACKFYWKPEPYSIDLRYIELLLQKGANPNYALERDYTNEKGHYQRATSAIHEASSLDLGMVKLLIKYGADPYKRLNETYDTPFKESFKNGDFEISNYFIDTLKVNPKDYVENNVNGNWGIQDYIVTKFLKAKLQGNTTEMARLKSENPKIEKANQNGWEFIQKLERMGIDFKNYKFKK